jgi:hypothetical protein
MKKVVLLSVGILLALGTSCRWVKLAHQALIYRTTAVGEAANVVANGAFAYATLAEEGLAVVDASTGRRVAVVPPPPGSGSIDDVALADGLLFALDARKPGALSVFRLENPEMPALVSGPVAVDVGPFSGVSAATERVIVSGGTSLLSLRSYDAQGKLGHISATSDLGRGQPDVLISPDGTHAYVSTHYQGPDFGLRTLDIGLNSLTPSGDLPIDGAGFTPGGAKPANFPIEGALSGSTLWIAYDGGLAAIDVSDPSSPRRIGSLDLKLEAVNVDAEGGMAAVVGAKPSPKLVWVDIADPRSPKILRTVELPAGTYPTGVALAGGRAVVAAHGAEVLIVDR